MVDLALGIFSAAMFAEPAVTNVEEVVGLVHGRKNGVGVGCKSRELRANKVG